MGLAYAHQGVENGTNGPEEVSIGLRDTCIRKRFHLSYLHRGQALMRLAVLSINYARNMRLGNV
jgi:hypothetical protein